MFSSRKRGREKWERFHLKKQKSRRSLISPRYLDFDSIKNPVGLIVGPDFGERVNPNEGNSRDHSRGGIEKTEWGPLSAAR